MEFVLVGGVGWSGASSVCRGCAFSNSTRKESEGGGVAGGVHVSAAKSVNYGAKS